MSTSAVDGLDWHVDAACRGADPELFFPDDDIRFTRARVKMAKIICRSCPVSVTCLSWALTSGEEGGIWGGLTENERHRLLHRGRTSRPPANDRSRKAHEHNLARTIPQRGARKRAD
jgi:WhiB family transcriptional regulator, redox-sensing transcriptional regulator